MGSASTVHKGSPAFGDSGMVIEEGMFDDAEKVQNEQWNHDMAREIMCFFDNLV